MQRVGDPVGRGHPEADRVRPGRGHGHGVVEPLPGVRPADVVRAARRAGVRRVGGVLQVDPVRAVAVGRAVGRGHVVGDALPAGVVVRRLDGAGHRGRGPAERLVAGAAATAAAAARAEGERHVVEVPPVGVLVHPQRLLPGRQRDAGVDRRPGLVAARVGDGDRAGQVGAGGVRDVQRVGDPVRGRHPERDRVGAGRGHVDRVVEPLPGRRPADVVGAGAGVVGGVGGRLEVDPVGAVAVGGPVGGGDVVGDALAAGVVVGRVDGAWHRRRGAAVGGPGRSGGGRMHAARHRHGGQHRARQPDPAQAAGERPGAPAPGRPRPVN